MNQRTRTRLIAYGLAVLAPAATLLVRWPLAAVLGDRVMYMAFLPAVLIVAYYGGFGPGLLATVFSAAVATYFLIVPFHTVRVTTVHDTVALGLLLLVGTIISLLSESLQRACRRVEARERERQRAEDAVRQSERRYAVTLSSIGDAVIAADNNGLVTFMNPVAEALTGWPQGQAMGRRLTEVFRIINEETREPVEDPAAKVLRLGCVVGLANHTALISRDGREVLIDDSGAPIIDDGLGTTGVVLVFRDTTLRRQAEGAEALRKANARLELALQGSNIGIWEIEMPDGDYRRGRWYHVNIWEQLGYEHAETRAPNETGMLPVHPDDRDRLDQAIRGYMAGETSEFEMENRVRHKEGSYRWLLTRGTAVRDAAGKPIRFLGIAVDITDRKRAEQALRESEHRWRSLTEALPQLVWTAMPDGACDYFSTQWTQFTGVPANLLLDWQWMQTLHPDDRGPTRQFWMDALAERSGYDVNYRVRRSDGEYRWFKTRGLPIRDSEGAIFKWFGTCTDITDAKVAAEELRLAKEAAESANRAKDEFLANVSHEIRTPMNAILGLTTLVLGTRLDDGQRQSLATVKSAADNLLGIINDLLDFSKIEAGKLTLDPGDFSLRAALGDTLRALAIRAHEKGLELASNVQPEVPDALIGDAGRLRQILLNIVGNAIKFTGKGEVIVQVGVIADGASTKDEVELLFTVRDTGIGIPREKHAAIFRAFEQEDSSTTRKYGGSGLGLTIAAQLAALMGGRITVESEPGQGSTFSITARFARSAKREAISSDSNSADLLEDLRVLSAHLVKPMQQSELLETIRHVMTQGTADAPSAPAASSAGTQPALPAPAEPLHILVAEDNEFNVTLLEQLFARKGHRARIAGDGREALALATEGAFDVLLLDIHLPEMDGFAVAKAIREHEAGSGKHLPIIAFTARSGKQDRERCLAAGMDDFLSKPVQAEELWLVIDRAVAAHPPDKQPDARLLDPQAILRACGGEAVILEKICQAFQASAPRQFARVRSALNDKDAPRLREAAHALSSTLAAFSTTAGAAASTLEDEAANGRIEECIPLVGQLESMCDGLLDQTRKLSIERLSS